MRQNVKTGLRRVTETGVLLALLIVLQAATRSAGQYVTGHGVGLCQIGAAVMGERGFNYRQILSHYFKDAEIRSIY